MRSNWMFPFCFLLALGCGGPPPASGPVPGGLLEVVETPVSFSVVEASTRSDPEVEALVAPFRDRMGEEISRVIGETTGMLSEAWPEGTLGNFAADAMLWAANREVEEAVAMALTNSGGLRVPIGPGPITMGQMYELMPFENMLSVLVLSGAQIQDLCTQIAEKRGEPIAGFSFRIESVGETRVARDILIDGTPLDLSAEYRLVTNDYMANGGDSFPALESPISRVDLPVLLREALINYIGHMGVIEPKLEGRISGGIRP